MNGSLELSQHVIVPDELATGRGKGTQVSAHLTLKREGEVVRVAEVEVAGQVDILKHFQVPVYMYVQRKMNNDHLHEFKQQSYM